MKLSLSCRLFEFSMDITGGLLLALLAMIPY